MPTPPPELIALRRELRQYVAIDVAARHARNNGTSTSSSELRADIDRLVAAGRVQRARFACEHAKVKVSKDLDRRAIRQTRNGWITADGRRVTRSERFKNVAWVNAPADSAWDPEIGLWV